MTTQNYHEKRFHVNSMQYKTSKVQNRQQLLHGNWTTGAVLINVAVGTVSEAEKRRSGDTTSCL